MMFILIKRSLLIFVHCLLFTSFISATIRKVPQDYYTIQGAIDGADIKDTVFISNGVYSGLFRITKSLSLIGESADSVLLFGFDPSTTTVATIEVQNINNVEIASMKITGRGYSIWYPGCAALSISNSDSIKLHNVVMQGGKGASYGKMGGWSWGPQNGGDAIILSNSKEVWAEDCFFYKGSPGANAPIWSPVQYPDADSGYSIKSENYSEIIIENSYVPFPIFYDETSRITIDNKVYYTETAWKKILTNLSYSLNDISFAGKNIGNIVGDNGIILKTIDGGETWTSQSVNTTSSLKSVFLVDSSNRVAVGDNGTIIKTTNGGKDWIVLSVVTNYHLKDVVFIDSLVGIIVGTFGTILKTTDGGMNWNQKPGGDDYYLYGVDFADEKNGVAVGDYGWWSSGIILRTSDGGETWTKEIDYYPTQNTSLFSISYCNNKKGIAVGNGVLSTTDGGQTWNRIYGGKWKSVSCFDINNFMAVGVSEILCTKDGGSTWNQDNYGNGTSFNSVFYTDTNDIIIAGANGTILRTTTGGIISAVDEKQKTNILSGNFTLSQNYPNPFNPTTTISYQLPVTSNVKLKVYDILGREVATLVNEEKPAGSYEVEFNGSGLSSGIYFYQLKAGNFIQTKKFVLMK